MKTLLLTLTLFSTVSFAKTVELPKVKIPSVTVQRGASLNYIMLTPYCVAEASIMDQMNNGMKPYTNCKDRSSQLKRNVENGHVVKANADGSFNLPALTESYSTSKSAILCVEIQGVSSVEAIPWAPYMTVATETLTQPVRLCTQAGVLPTWFADKGTTLKADSLDSYVSILSKPIVLKAK